MRIVLAFAAVMAVLLGGGVASASAAVSPACSSAPPTLSSYPSNPFGPNVTIFNPSQSLATINAALTATTTPRNAPREFFFLPGTSGDGDPEQHHPGAGRQRHGRRRARQEPV